jgi:hypothetical protein
VDIRGYIRVKVVRCRPCKELSNALQVLLYGVGLAGDRLTVPGVVGAVSPSLRGERVKYDSVMLFREVFPVKDNILPHGAARVGVAKPRHELPEIYKVCAGGLFAAVYPCNKVIE